MILNEFSLLELFVFLRYQTFPILLSLIFLSIGFPILIYYLINRDRQNKSYLFLSLAFVFLFAKEAVLFFVSRRIVFDLNLIRIDFSLTLWTLVEAFHLYLFFFFLFQMFKEEIVDKSREIIVPTTLFLKEKIFGAVGILGVFILFTILGIFSLNVDNNSLDFIPLLMGILMIAFTLLFHYCYINIKRDYKFLISSWYPKSIFSFPLFYLTQVLFIMGIVVLGLLFVYPSLSINIWPHWENPIQNAQTYFHGLKAFLYFLLLLVVVQLLKSKANSILEQQKIKEKISDELEKFHQKIEKKKLNYSLPKTLISIFLDHCLEKFDAEFVIINLGEENFLKINIQSPFYSFKSWKNDSPTLEEWQKFFPYLEVVFEERKKKYFIYKFNQHSKSFQENYPYLMKEELLSRDSIPVHSLIFFPMNVLNEVQEEVNIGSCVFINQINHSSENESIKKSADWNIEETFAFLEILFPTLKNLVDYYVRDHQEQIKRRNLMLDKRIQEQQNEFIRKIGNIFHSEPPNPQTGFDLSFDSLYPSKPRYNFCGYVSLPKERRMMLVESKGNSHYLPSVNMMLRNKFFNSIANPKGVIEENQSLIDLFFDEVSMRCVVLSYDMSKKRVRYAITAHHPILVYRAQKKRFDFLGSNEDVYSEETLEQLTEPDSDRHENSISNIEKKVSVENNFFEEGHFDLNKGDMFFVASQDVFRLRNTKQEIFDFSKLEKIFSKNFKEDTSIISRRIRQALDDYGSFIPESHQVFFIGKIS